jgi:hypothetical protein
MSLNARDLWKQTDQQRTIKMNAMKPVLTNLFAQLKSHAAKHPESPVFAFDVPSFVFGYPLFNHTEAIEYCKEFLEERGFQVWVSGSVLVISWIKPIKNTSTKSHVIPTGPSYRPFVYDDSTLEFLRSKINQ